MLQVLSRVSVCQLYQLPCGQPESAYSVKNIHPDASAIKCIVVLAVQREIWLVKAVQIPRGITLL